MLNLALPRASLRAQAIDALRRFADRVAAEQRRRAVAPPQQPAPREPALWILHAR